MNSLEKVDQRVNRSSRRRPRPGIQAICHLAGLGDEGTSLVLTLFDISNSGLRVIAPLPLNTGQQIALRLINPGEQMELKHQAEVVWSTPRPDGAYWVGLQLEKPLSDVELAHLGRGKEDQADTPEEHITVRWLEAPDPLVARTAQQACLICIYPTGTDMGKRHFLGYKPLVLGRDEDADLCLRDHAVSRLHARIQPTETGFEIIDLKSTNGTFVNQASITRRPLQDGDYVQVGSCIFRFLAGGNIEADYHEELYRLTISDALTGIPNKRFLLEFLERELARSRRYSRPLSVIMFDVDLFKTVNDRMGHLAGDFTLREMAARVKYTIRKEELFARYGGEEFALVLPETPLDLGRNAAERIRSLVEARSFTYDGSTFQITISAGVVSTNGDEWLNPEEILRRADEKLYQAKKTGRNRVVA